MKTKLFVEFERQENGLLINLLEGVEKVDLRELVEDLFWDDMYLIDTGDGWLNIGHENSDSVYHINGYYYDMMVDLNNNRTATFPISSMKYSEYELED